MRKPQPQSLRQLCQRRRRSVPPKILTMVENYAKEEGHCLGELNLSTYGRRKRGHFQLNHNVRVTTLNSQCAPCRISECMRVRRAATVVAFRLLQLCQHHEGRPESRNTDNCGRACTKGGASSSRVEVIRAGRYISSAFSAL